MRCRSYPSHGSLKPEAAANFSNQPEHQAAALCGTHTSPSALRCICLRKPDNLHHLNKVCRIALKKSCGPALGACIDVVVVISLARSAPDSDEGDSAAETAPTGVCMEPSADKDAR